MSAKKSRRESLNIQWQLLGPLSCKGSQRITGRRSSPTGLERQCRSFFRVTRLLLLLDPDHGVYSITSWVSVSTGDTALGIYFLRDRLALNPRMHVGYLLPLPWRKLWLLPSHAFQLLYVFFQYNFFNPENKGTNKSFTVLNKAQGSYLVIQDQHFILVCNILQISH